MNYYKARYNVPAYKIKTLLENKWVYFPLEDTYKNSYNDVKFNYLTTCRLITERPSTAIFEYDIYFDTTTNNAFYLYYNDLGILMTRFYYKPTPFIINNVEYSIDSLTLHLPDCEVTNEEPFMVLLNDLNNNNNFFKEFIFIGNYYDGDEYLNEIKNR